MNQCFQAHKRHVLQETGRLPPFVGARQCMYRRYYPGAGEREQAASCCLPSSAVAAPQDRPGATRALCQAWVGLARGGCDPQPGELDDAIAELVQVILRDPARRAAHCRPSQLIVLAA